MKQKNLIVLFAAFLFACKKNKSPEQEPKKNVVYISGYVINNPTATQQIPCYWKDTNLVLLEIPAGMRGTAYTIIQSNKNLYVLGSYGMLVGSDTSCIWKNGIRTNLELPPGTINWDVKDMFVAGDDVFAAGSIVVDAGSWKPSYWKNGVYTEITETANHAEAAAIWVSGTDIYLAGIIDRDSRACYWKNGVRVTLPNPNANGLSTVSDIKVAGNDVLVAGRAPNGAGTWGAVYWKNGILHTLGTNTRSHSDGIETSGDDIYVAGSTYESGMEAACYWKNATKLLLAKLPHIDISLATSIRVAGTDVHIAGEAANITTGLFAPCYWKNNVFNYLPLKNYELGSATSIFIGE